MLRAAAGLAVAAVVCVIVTNVYALFGHGIRSDAMDFMFLYPLGGAAAVLLYHFALMRVCGRALSRSSLNLILSGIAALTLGAMLTGILYIAGGSSGLAPVFPALGWALCAAGTLAGAINMRKPQ